MFNQMLALFGMDPEIWMIRASSFRTLPVATDTWKNFGYGAIIVRGLVTGAVKGSIHSSSPSK